MTHGVFTKLAKYNQAMNAAVYAAADKLSDDQRKADLGAYFKSIQATLNHLLWADKTWLRRFIVTGHGYGILEKEIYADIENRVVEPPFTIHENFDALKQARFELDRKIIVWVSEGLSDSKLGQILDYKNMRGEEQSRPFADVLTHFFNHQTHHRGQVTTLLTQQGVDTGVTDFIFYSAGF